MIKNKRRRWTLFTIAYQLVRGGDWKIFETHAYYRDVAEREFYKKVGVSIDDVYDYANLSP